MGLAYQDQISHTQILALPLPNSVLSTLFSFSVPQFPHHKHNESIPLLRSVLNQEWWRMPTIQHMIKASLNYIKETLS